MKSIDVVTAVMGHMISNIKTKTGLLQTLSIELKYVLTIPTCSCKDSRVFMKEAVVKVICMFLILNLVFENND